jgi:molecular chaperone DnaJ
LGLPAKMDLYEILGISRGATVVEIKRSYRRLARKYHPDVNPGDAGAEARFREITRAQEVLCDPDRRRRYDALGVLPESGAQEAYGFEGFDFSHAASSAERTTFGDLFADVLRQPGTAAQSAGAERGADLHTSVSLTFEEALRGVDRQLTVTRREACRSCRGTGMLRASESVCVRCQGAGAIRSAHGHMVFARACPTCGGSGRLQQAACPACGGASLENRSEVVVVPVPAGVTDGARIRVAGKGNAGPGGGPCGDLFVGIQVALHRLFRRDGDDFHLVVPIAIHEAALGAKIDVPSPDGVTARLRIPPGTQSGQRFRLRERGAPSPRDGRRGDLVIEVKLVLPRLLDERSKELLREFGKINREDVRSEYS